MDYMYLILVVVLFLLAFSDLIVGVSNDAVNFLNSAIGSKAAPFKVIMIIAALGILVGATFSNGMMEVARKGIFHPQHFFFDEIMIIFLAVMITDVILLDVFNTFGLPTSTTVSIVFELLGAAVAISLMKLSQGNQIIQLEGGGEQIAELVDYINTGKALGIITGILLSVVVAFSVGALVQYITRLIFSFNYASNIKYFGAIWGGMAITAITYFIFIKGLKGSSFAASDFSIVTQGSLQEMLAWAQESLGQTFASIEEMGKALKGKYNISDSEGTYSIAITTKQWVSTNTLYVLGGSFIGWSLILQVLKFFKVNILRIIVLVGTFALAMAFAGNDLVNFIGVPLAGFKAFQEFISTGGSAETLNMGVLSGKVDTEAYMLVIAGLVMVATLWLSKKARSVVKTSLDLSRQGAGDERFGSSIFARTIVRVARNTSKSMGHFVPAGVKKAINSRFDQTEYKKRVNSQEDAPAFDMIRASVNLVVASILISFATSLKLPLSTTYVTFMVAMGTSLADQAWGRESAVYRITGVISVIGGWFFTAFSAFTAAFIVALIISIHPIMIAVLVILAATFIYRTHKIHKKREAENEKAETAIETDNIVQGCTVKVTDILKAVLRIYNQTLDGLSTENRKALKDAYKEVKSINNTTKTLKDNITKTIKKLEADSIDTGHHYVQVLDYLRETAHCLTYIAGPGFEHVDNNHNGFTLAQIEDLDKVKSEVTNLYHNIIDVIANNNFNELPRLVDKQQEMLTLIEDARKKQIKRIKYEEAGTKESMLYLGILHETKNLLLYTINLLKAQRDFIEYDNN